MVKKTKKKTRVGKHESSTNLLFLSALAFILVSSTSLSLHQLTQPAKEIIVFDTVAAKESNLTEAIAPLPVLAAQTEAEVPTFTAASIMAVDVDSGVTLFEKNPDEVLYPASTTKMLTALVALEIYKLDEVVTVPAKTIDGQKMGLVAGETILVENLLKGMLIWSANDAAETLAAYHPQGYYGFIDAMNEKAIELHMTNSHFTNASGLENPQHVSTARDMARVAKAAMNNPFFSEIVATKKVTVTSVDGTHVHRLTNLNKLIGTVDGVIGIKTGYTEHARENLVTYVERDGKRIVIALLGSEDRFGETKTLIDWVYGSYRWQEVTFP